MTISPKAQISVSILFIVIITFITFSPSLKNNFICVDDLGYVVQNDSVDKFSFENIKNIFTHDYLGNYHPLTILTYAWEYNFFGLNPRVYHATNVMLHLLNCIMVFWIILIISKDISTAALTALLFGIHPLRVESVAWISERKDVLYSFFFLCSLVSYLYYVNMKSKRYLYYSFILFFFSLLSKVTAVIFPLFLYMFDYLLNRKFNKKLFVEKIPFFLFALIFGIISIIFLKKLGGINIAGDYPLQYRISLIFYGLISYLYKILLPIRLSALYPYPQATFAFYSVSLFAVVLVSGLAFIVFRLRYTNRKIVFGTLFFFLGILLGLQIIPVGVAFMADRYTYIPSIGIFYIISEACRSIYNMRFKYQAVAKSALIVILISIIAAMSFLTYSRISVWKDSFILLRDVLKTYPRFSGVYMLRGRIYAQKDEVDKAISDFNRVIEIDPNCAPAYYNRAVMYFCKRQFDRSWEDMHKAERCGYRPDKDDKILNALKSMSGRES